MLAFLGGRGLLEDGGRVSPLSMVSQSDGHLVWVGPRVWPYPPALVQSAPGSGRPSQGCCEQWACDAGQSPILARSLFVRAETPADRLWATDLALRSPAARVVIADASGFDLAGTRRLQLAAEAGGALCLLTRPPWEASELSAAGTRWLVRRHPAPRADRASDRSSGGHQGADRAGDRARCSTGPPTPEGFESHPFLPITSRRWTVELLRCKGLRPIDQGRDRLVWIMERDHATRRLRVVPDLPGGSGVEETPAPPARPAIRLVG